VQKWEVAHHSFFFNCQVPNRAEAEISGSSQGAPGTDRSGWATAALWWTIDTAVGTSRLWLHDYASGRLPWR